MAFSRCRIAPSFPEKQVVPFFKFLIKDEALGDRSPDVRLSVTGWRCHHRPSYGVPNWLGCCTHLAGPSSTNETGDEIKEAVAIPFGREARHLAASDPRISSVVDRLVEALQTPSEQVQMAVSDCLVPLVTLMGEDRCGLLIDQLFKALFDMPKYVALGLRVSGRHQGVWEWYDEAP